MKEDQDRLPEWALRERDELRRERDLWRQRATFWMGTTLTEANRQSSLEQASENLVNMVTGYVLVGLETGDFFPDILLTQRPADAFPDDDLDEAIRKYEQLTAGIPFGVVREIAGQVGFDAVELIEDYIGKQRRNLEYAETLVGKQPQPHPSGWVQLKGEDVIFSAMPISRLPQEMADQIFAENFADSYVLHVYHDGDPCRHPYQSLDEAVEGAAIDEMSGAITQASHIVHRDEIVMQADELRQRIDQIKAAGSN